MNLLLISRCPPFPLHLGDRLIPYHLVEQLSTRHQVDLIAFYNLPDDLSQVEEYRHLFRSIRLVREPRRSVTSYVWRLVNSRSMFPQRPDHSWSPEMWQAIKGQLDANHYDVAQLFGGVQVYVVPYESYSLFLERLLARQVQPLRRLAVWIQLQVARAYERRMYVVYDGVVVLSDSDADTLNALKPDLPLHVIPNGIDTEYFKPLGKMGYENFEVPLSPALSPHAGKGSQTRLPSPSLPAGRDLGWGKSNNQTTASHSNIEMEHPTLLFVGNYEYAPNVDAALRLVNEIFPLVRESIPHVRLQLVGNAPPDELRALASPEIEVTGRVPDVRPYLERATLVISPLRLGAGIKNKVLEAMAMGKPLVATPLSCEGIALVEGEHVLFGNSANELAMAAIRLINDPELCGTMAGANRQMIESRYTWRHVAEQYEALYGNLIAERQGDQIQRAGHDQPLRKTRIL